MYCKALLGWSIAEVHQAEQYSNEKVDEHISSPFRKQLERMAQKPAQFCVNCGAPLEAGQRFCTNCGTTMGADANNPTAMASQTPQAPYASRSGNNPGPVQPSLSAPNLPNVNQPFLPPVQTGSDPYLTNLSETAPPPPPPGASTYNPYATSAPEARSYSPESRTVPDYIPPPAGGSYPPVPAYAQKPRRSRGCFFTSLLLLVVLAAGIGGYVYFNRASNKTPQNNSSSSTGGGGPTGSTPDTGSTSTAGGGSIEQLNLKITYASVNITLISTQVASSFPDDTSTTPGSAGVVRLNFRESNPITRNPEYLESDAFLLVLPDGTTIQSSNQHANVSPDGGVSRLNWADFPLSSQVALNQLVLRIGKVSENQMNVPLQSAANLSKYQDQTINPNAKFKYAGVDWTLKTAVKSYSYNATQASTGNLYVIVTLAVVNSSSTELTGVPGNYMRLQGGGSTQEPDSTYTFPTSVASSGGTASGVVAFLMPEGATSFTLIMLGNTSYSPPITQATQPFQFS